ALGAAPVTRWPYAAAGAGPGTGYRTLLSGPSPASVPHSLLLEAAADRTGERRVLLYISRWLAAPVQMPGGTITAREERGPAGFPGHAPNAKGNFCFEVTLGYRRLELGR